MRHRALFAILGLLSSAGASLHAEAPSCAAPTATVRGAAVIDDLDIALEDGRTLKLAGIDPARATLAHPELGEAARHRLETAVVGRDLAVAVLSASPDRWDRYSALVTDAGAPGLPGGSINEVLIAEGWARARPEPALRPCLPAWLMLEARARASGLGLWADPYYSVIEAGDRTRLAERTGAMAIVEGSVERIQSGGRMSLRLGGAGFVALLTRGGSTSLAHAGLDPPRLVGARLRLRGFLDDRFGPRIDVTDAGQIEVIDAASARQGNDRTIPTFTAPTENMVSEVP